MAQAKPLPGSGEKLPRFQGKRFLTTYLTITRFGVHGDSGDESSKEQLFWNKRCQKGAEIVRRKFHQLFGSRMPRVRVSPLGPKPPVFSTKTGGFVIIFCIFITTNTHVES